MLLPVTSKVDAGGHLVIGGCDVISLGKKYGTPLYIIDLATLRRQMEDYRKYFGYPDLETGIIYASKAFTCTAMAQLVSEYGLGMDVSTGGELYIALNAGVPPEKILFHGNNKSYAEIVSGLDSKVGVFVVDNFHELQMLADICRERNIRQDIMIRITPGVKASTHEYIQTGNQESKFGFAINGQDALEAIKITSGSGNLKLKGIHAHIGSQIFNISCYDRLVEVMIKFMARVKEELGISLAHLDIGGGLGVKYVPEDRPPSIGDLAGVIYDAVKKYSVKFSHGIDKLYLEPGRSIVGNAGVTLYEVGAVKEIKDIRNYAAIDGGMSDNIRPILYGAKYHAYLANRMEDIKSCNEEDIRNYSIVGKHCESGDVIIDDIRLPQLKSGDFIVVGTTGAYCYSMASNYNGQPMNAVVAVEEGKSRLWIERQAYNDLTIRDKRLYGD
ncbi:MAG: diaminopimelate decarboxylase [Actinobacteria bacterium]|nr:diaminopimelate decarboxylase [Actinomycetota bacterium]